MSAEYETKYARAFDSGVLVPERHQRLVDNLDYYAGRAGIAPEYVWTSIVGVLDDTEIRWLKNVKNREDLGAVYTGLHEPPPEIRMCAAAGLLLRNFKTARVMTASEVVDAVLTGDTPDPFALFITNLMDGRREKDFAARAQIIPDVVSSRVRRRRQTVMSFSNLARAREIYGDDLYMLIAGGQFIMFEGHPSG